MAKKTITIPKPQARLMQAYLKFSEVARKQWKFLLLRDFVAYAQEQGWTEEKNGALWLKDNIEFTFED